MAAINGHSTNYFPEEEFKAIGTDLRYVNISNDGAISHISTVDKLCRFMEIFFKAIPALLGYEISYSFIPSRPLNAVNSENLQQHEVEDRDAVFNQIEAMRNNIPITLTQAQKERLEGTVTLISFIALGPSVYDDD